MENKISDEVLLKVENLCQYFKLGKTTLKAVDNVTFDIHKGEVFGLVGESGCGKTTTGRTIIKIYDATSGNVYFKGQRICAGVKSYKDKIRESRKMLKDASLSEEEKSNLQKIILEQKEEIKRAKYDQKCCDKDYIRSEVERLSNQDASSEEINIAKHKKLITQIQMIFQDPIASLDPRMTVKEIIAEGLRIQGIKDEAFITEQVNNMLELVGLVREHADRYPHEFSGGQRQRIGIARAVVMKPEMIIADEPISALDVSIQAQVINLLNELRDSLGLTILFIAHDLSVVKYFSDRIGVMYFGKMVELASSDELFKHPLHPYTKSLLSAIPLPDPVYEKQRQRIVYNPLASHDYSVEQPVFQEILPGHFVLCNSEEKQKYLEEVHSIDEKNETKSN